MRIFHELLLIAVDIICMFPVEFEALGEP